MRKLAFEDIKLVNAGLGSEVQPWQFKPFPKHILLFWSAKC